TMPSIATVSSISRMASTAALSALSFSPRPIHRPAASAAASVTRTSSTARLRSGRGPTADWLSARTLPVAIGPKHTPSSGRKRRLDGPRVRRLVEDDEGARHNHEQPTDDDGPPQGLTQDRPGGKRRRERVERGE